MARADFEEVKVEGRQFWEGLSTQGKAALAIAIIAVFAIGFVVGAGFVGVAKAQAGKPTSQECKTDPRKAGCQKG